MPCARDQEAQLRYEGLDTTDVNPVSADYLDTTDVNPVSADYLCVSCSSSKQLAMLQNSSIYTKAVILSGLFNNYPPPRLQKKSL